MLGLAAIPLFSGNDVLIVLYLENRGQTVTENNWKIKTVKAYLHVFSKSGKMTSFPLFLYLQGS